MLRNHLLGIASVALLIVFLGFLGGWLTDKAEGLTQPGNGARP